MPQTSNTAKPDPVPTLAVQKCATCERAVVKSAVEGHNPGGDCFNCSPSIFEDQSAVTLVLSEVKTISFGSYTAATTSSEDVTSTADESSNDPTASTPGPIITPTPFASALEPPSTTPHDPPSASATYVTAGSARAVVRSGSIGLVVLVIAMLL